MPLRRPQGRAEGRGRGHSASHCPRHLDPEGADWHFVVSFGLGGGGGAQSSRVTGAGVLAHLRGHSPNAHVRRAEVRATAAHKRGPRPPHRRRSSPGGTAHTSAPPRVPVPPRRRRGPPSPSLAQAPARGTPQKEGGPPPALRHRRQGHAQRWPRQGQCPVRSGAPDATSLEISPNTIPGIRDPPPPSREAAPPHHRRSPPATPSSHCIGPSDGAALRRSPGSCAGPCG